MAIIADALLSWCASAAARVRFPLASFQFFQSRIRARTGEPSRDAVGRSTSKLTWVRLLDS